ncbi:MAG TPA: DUF192 domain-containing protein [Caulobacteraceae bacterium]|jgi:hypothetical protein|nr:DUF192 domain-containing protein [Caulobacteraceae bacterium]
MSSFRLIRSAGALAAASACVLFAADVQATPNSTDPSVCTEVARELKYHTPPTQKLEIETRHGVRTFDVEVASDDATRELGLMCRKSMAPSHGMLFEFPQADPQSFWMKNTYIPLDIIYIGRNGRIVSIAANAKPFDESPLSSAGPADGVLEIKGGLSAKLGIKPGDRVKHPFYTAR